MSRIREMRIQSALLLILVPTLFLVTGVAGYLVYASLYSEILAGFDARLRSVSTVTAAFIDSDDHSRILQPCRLTALVFDPRTDRLLGTDTEGRLVDIDRTSGSARPAASLGARFLDLTWDRRRSRILGLEAPGNRLLEINPESGESQVLLNFDESFQALAWDEGSGRLYAAGGRLATIDPRNWSVSHIADLETGPLASLSDGPEPGVLIGVPSLGSEILRIEVGGPAPMISTVALSSPDSGDDVDENDGKAEPVTLRFLTYDPDQGVFWTGNDRLARLVPPDFRLHVFGYPGFRSESTSLYQKYVVPMRRIKQMVNLTYLYTFVLGRRDRQIIYGLDASTDKDHSNIGDVDSDPPEEGTVRVFHQGGVHLSDIEFWEQWGLIKSADAAIYDRNGDIRAIAGADINISIIEQKTRSALLKVCLIGILCLGFASLAAVTVSNRLVRPIERLKTEALKVAAGQFGERVQVDSPTELQELAHSFNDMSAALKTTLEGLTRSNQQLERERRRTELVLSLASRTDLSRVPDGSPVVCGRLCQQPARRDASGWTVVSSQLYAWIVSPSPDDPYEAVRLRSDLATTFTHLARAHSGQWESIRRFFEPLFRDSVQALINIDLDTGEHRLSVRGSLPGALIDRNGAPRLLNLTEREAPPRVARGEGLLLTDPEVIHQLTKESGILDPSILHHQDRLRDFLASIASKEGQPDRDDLFISVWRVE
jgi:HAMP domain-containing protein